MSQSIDWAALHQVIEGSQRAIDSSLEMGGERLDALLQERARQLSQRREATQSEADVTKVLAVRAGGQRYGLELGGLGGILPLRQWAPVPGAPSELLGIIGNRGEIWAAFELGRLVGAAPVEGGGKGFVVLLRHRRRRVGLRVDEVEQVERVSRGELRHSSNGDSTGSRPLIKGMVRNAMLLVDLDAVWAHPAIGGGSATWG
jgi:purine-binding chemotaxis protein CheW